MPKLAAMLERTMAKTVLDQTNLPGDGVSIFAALQNRLGLKLDARRGPVVTFVVQHAEKPAELADKIDE